MRLRLLLSLLFLAVTLLASPQQEAKIRSILESRFQQHYPTLQIHAITLKPATSLITKLQAYEVADVALSRDDLRRSRGNVMVTLQKGDKRRKLYFRYRIDADITLYAAATTLQKERAITPDVAIRKTVPFTLLYHQPIDDKDFYRYVAKQRIKAGTILTRDKLKRGSDISRNDTVTAIIRDGGVALTFEARALQSGNVGDIIKIRKDYKRQFKARIISNTRVEVVE